MAVRDFVVVQLRADVRARLFLHALELATLARRDDAVGLGLALGGANRACSRSSRLASRRLSWPQATPASIRACWFASRWSMRGVGATATWANAPIDATARVMPVARS